jgi:hypothetical protein
MLGWFTLLKSVLGIAGKIFGKYQIQKHVADRNKIKELSFKLKKRELEREALQRADEEITNHRDYLNKS